MLKGQKNLICEQLDDFIFIHNQQPQENLIGKWDDQQILL